MITENISINQPGLKKWRLCKMKLTILTKELTPIVIKNTVIIGLNKEGVVFKVDEVKFEVSLKEVENVMVEEDE